MAEQSRSSNRLLSAEEWLLTAAASGLSVTLWYPTDEWWWGAQICLFASMAVFAVGAIAALRLVTGTDRDTTAITRRKREVEREEPDDGADWEDAATVQSENEVEREEPYRRADQESPSTTAEDSKRRWRCMQVIVLGMLIFLLALLLARLKNEWEDGAGSGDGQQGGFHSSGGIQVVITDEGDSTPRARKWIPLGLAMTGAAALALGAGVYLLANPKTGRAGRVFGAALISSSSFLILRPDALASFEFPLSPESLFRLDSLLRLEFEVADGGASGGGVTGLRLLGESAVFKSGEPLKGLEKPDCATLLKNVKLPEPGELVSVLLVGGVDQTPVREDRPDLSNRKIALARAQEVGNCLQDRYGPELDIAITGAGPSNVGQRVPDWALAEDRRVAVFGQERSPDAVADADRTGQLPVAPRE